MWWARRAKSSRLLQEPATPSPSSSRGRRSKPFYWAEHMDCFLAALEHAGGLKEASHQVMWEVTCLPI